MDIRQLELIGFALDALIDREQETRQLLDDNDFNYTLSEIETLRDHIEDLNNRV